MDNKDSQLVSQFYIGQPVFVTLAGMSIPCYVKRIIFTNSKVRYSLYVEQDLTTIHNVDSVFVTALDGDNRTQLDFGADNGS